MSGLTLATTNYFFHSRADCEDLANDVLSVYLTIG